VRDANSSLFESVRRLLEHLLALAQVRLELATTELSLEVHRAARVLLWAFVALLSVALGLLMLALTIVIAVWDEHRVLAGMLLTGAFLAVSVSAVWLTRRSIHVRPPLLATSIEELRRDREALLADSPR
jgi:uncharacterized membrane protein YqjE